MSDKKPWQLPTFDECENVVRWHASESTALERFIFENEPVEAAEFRDGLAAAIAECVATGRGRLTAERDRLLAELAELRAQVPAAWIRGDRAMTQDTLSDHDIADTQELLRHGWQPLYAAPVQAQVPDGYAGVMVWVGPWKAAQIVSEVEIRLERDTGNAMTNASQRCLDMIAAAQKKEGK